MKCLKLAIAIALSCGVSAATALAQTGLQQPPSVQRTGFEYGSYDYYAQDDVTSPGDKVVPPPAPNGNVAPAAASCSTGASCTSGCASKCDNGCTSQCDTGCASKCDTCTSGCGACNDCLECEDEEPWRLFPTKDCCGCEREWSVTGWVEAGITYNAHSPDDHFNGPVMFNDRDDGQMNQFYAVMQNSVETDGCEWDLGGRVDLMYGTDGRFLEAPGLELEDDGDDHWNTARFYRLAMPQAYAELGGNDWSIKIGRFYTPMGYEVVTAPDNFFYSHAYAFAFAEPFTHTGVLATKTLSDRLSIQGSVYNGWDTFDDDDDEIGFMGGFVWTSCDEQSKLAFTLCTGEEDNILGGENTTDRTMYSVVYTRTMSERLTYILQHDMGWQDDFFATGRDDSDVEWYGINQYLIYKINCCWSAGTRIEWFRDDDGVRVAGNAKSGNTFGGVDGNFWELTTGLNYKPSANLTIRPEVRYDWFDGDADPFDNGTEDDQLTAAIDVIVLW